MPATAIPQRTAKVSHFLRGCRLLVWGSMRRGMVVQSFRIGKNSGGGVAGLPGWAPWAPCAFCGLSRVIEASLFPVRKSVMYRLPFRNDRNHYVFDQPA